MVFFNLQSIYILQWPILWVFLTILCTWVQTPFNSSLSQTLIMFGSFLARSISTIQSSLCSLILHFFLFMYPSNYFCLLHLFPKDIPLCWRFLSLCNIPSPIYFFSVVVINSLSVSLSSCFHTNTSSTTFLSLHKLLAFWYILGSLNSYCRTFTMHSWRVETTQN